MRAVPTAPWPTQTEGPVSGPTSTTPLKAITPNRITPSGTSTANSGAPIQGRRTAHSSASSRASAAAPSASSISRLSSTRCALSRASRNASTTSRTGRPRAWSISSRPVVLTPKKATARASPAQIAPQTVSPRASADSAMASSRPAKQKPVSRAYSAWPLRGASRLASTRFSAWSESFLRHKSTHHSEPAGRLARVAGGRPTHGFLLGSEKQHLPFGRHAFARLDPSPIIDYLCLDAAPSLEWFTMG